MLEKSNNQSLEIYTWIILKESISIFPVNSFIHFSRTETF